MSEFHVNVVKLGAFTPHPNADTLDITKVFDYQVITKRGAFKEGDLAVYIPIDSTVPDTEEWYWLFPCHQDGSKRFPCGQVPEKYRVIDAKKIRGIFSQGCLMPLPSGGDPRGWVEGMEVAVTFGITKYEPPVPMTTGGECEAPPKGWVIPVYTDIEGLRRYPHILQEGEEVVITEKIHGANGRFVHDGERLWVGSHTQIKKQDALNLWWQVASSYDLATQLARVPDRVFFGEVYGQVQDLKYGVKSGVKFRVFDVFNTKTMRYLDHDHAVVCAEVCGLEWVPTLYRGPWHAGLNDLCEGMTTVTDVVAGGLAELHTADHVREGFVVKPTKERWHEEIGRVILKRHGEGYLLRKKK